MTTGLTMALTEADVRETILPRLRAAVITEIGSNQDVIPAEWEVARFEGMQNIYEFSRYFASLAYLISMLAEALAAATSGTAIDAVTTVLDDRGL